MRQWYETGFAARLLGARSGTTRGSNGHGPEPVIIVDRLVVELMVARQLAEDPEQLHARGPSALKSGE